MGLAEILGLFYLLKERRLLFLTRTAILVDGGFYRKRAAYLWGQKTAEERAKELTAIAGHTCIIKMVVSADTFTESFIMIASRWIKLFIIRF